MVCGRNILISKGTLQAALLYSLFYNKQYQHQTGSTSLRTDEQKEVDTDFKASVWKAINREFPAVRIRGCIFRWTQAVWRNVQQAGLQVPYMKDAATYSYIMYIRKILALPMLLLEHITPVFASIRQDNLRVQSLISLTA